MYNIYPANGYATSMDIMRRAAGTIEAELEDRLKFYKEEGKPREAERLAQRGRYALVALREVGVCAGLEHYSRQFDGR